MLRSIPACRDAFAGGRLGGICRGVIVASGLLAATLGWSGSAGAQAELRIATEGAYPPFNFVEGSEPAGFEIELGRALCQAMGLPCLFVLQDWDSMFGGLKENRYDAIMSSMEITEERRTRYRFSRRYYAIPAALIGAKSAPAPAKPFRVAQLAGRPVGVVADSEFAAYLEGLANGPDVRAYNKLEEANLDLLTGRIEYVLGDKLALSRFLGTREGESCCRFIADLPVDRGPGIGVAVRKGDRGLAELFDRAIETVMANGDYDRIRIRYFPFDIK